MEHRRHRIRARRQRFRTHKNPRPINPAGRDIQSQQRHPRGHRARANHGCRRHPTSRGSHEGNEDGDRANVYGGRFPLGASVILMRSNRQSESTGHHHGATAQVVSRRPRSSARVTQYGPPPHLAVGQDPRRHTGSASSIRGFPHRWQSRPWPPRQRRGRIYAPPALARTSGSAASGVFISLAEGATGSPSDGRYSLPVASGCWWPGQLAWSASAAASVGGHAAGEPARGHAMKAIVQHEYGAPQDVLGLAEVAMPVVGEGEVLVSVRASSANPWDWHYIRGEPVLLRPALRSEERR